MILKQADDKSTALARLEALLRAGRIPRKHVDAVERHLRITQAGIQGERASACQIDLHASDSGRVAVIHDLRLELPDGRVAQIDHLLIHPPCHFVVLETQHFAHGLKITEEGGFLRWNDWKRQFERIPSPLEQNARNALVLATVLAELDVPGPVIQGLVLVAELARIDRPRSFDTTMVVKVDQFVATLQKALDAHDPLDSAGGMPATPLHGRVETLGKRLVALHRPLQADHLADLGIELLPAPRQAPVQAEVVTRITAVPTGPRATAATPETGPTGAATTTCKYCGGTDLSMHSGRYGYYFRCAPCQANTAVKVTCGQDGHQERLRKVDQQYFRECADCGTSTLFFVTPAH